MEGKPSWTTPSRWKELQKKREMTTSQANTYTPFEDKKKRRPWDVTLLGERRLFEALSVLALVGAIPCDKKSRNTFEERSRPAYRSPTCNPFVGDTLTRNTE